MSELKKNAQELSRKAEFKLAPTGSNISRMSGPYPLIFLPQDKTKTIYHIHATMSNKEKPHNKLQNRTCQLRSCRSN